MNTEYFWGSVVSLLPVFVSIRATLVLSAASVGAIYCSTTRTSELLLHQLLCTLCEHFSFSFLFSFPRLSFFFLSRSFIPTLSCGTFDSETFISPQQQQQQLIGRERIVVRYPGINPVLVHSPHVAQQTLLQCSPTAILASYRGICWRLTYTVTVHQSCSARALLVTVG